MTGTSDRVAAEAAPGPIVVTETSNSGKRTL